MRLVLGAVRLRVTIIGQRPMSARGLTELLWLHRQRHVSHNLYKFVKKGKKIPNFELIPLDEAKLRSATGRAAQITQESLAYIESRQASTS